MKAYLIPIVSAVLFASCTSSNEKEKKEPVASKASYDLATVEKGGVASSIKLPAQLAAYQEVSIFPKANGYVKTVLVDIGSKVSAGTLLMTLEAPELIQAAAQAKEKYARAKADYSIGKEKYNRLLEASATAGAISPLDLSTVRAKMEADSSLANAEKVNWEMQQTLLSYLKVYAPFDGVITERNVHPGMLVSATVKDKPMLELKQVAHLRLQVDMPEALSSTLKEKDTVSFYVSAMPGKRMVATISRVSMNVNAQYRTERMEMDVYNKDGALSPGMYADVMVQSKGNAQAFYVPRRAVVTSTERRYVLAVRDGKTVKVDVSTGNSTADKIEVYGALQTGEKIIANANDEIAEGEKI
ncbi:MAG: efflux RND transporter periplasmic adaptor subunit [Filimonas sp.]|nr:efflux RND transporter periplasmic adaptor subunit [Filimonas sp.]